MPRHSDAFLAARRPRVIVRDPEPVWVIDHYRVRRWYYRAAPEVGAKVLYLQDGFTTRVQRVNFFTIFFENGTAMQRPDVGRRMGEWVLPRLQNLIPNRTPGKVSRTPRLRPNAVTISV